MNAASVATPATAPASTPAGAPGPVRSAASAGRAAFLGMLRRDVTVQRKELPKYLPNVIMQPLLLLFVFTYVFPRIGQDISAYEDEFASLMMAGIVAHAAILQGVIRVALSIVQEFNITKELQDRVLAPISVPMIAVEKIVFATFQSMFAALIVFPVALTVPATTVYIEPDWAVLATVGILACVTSAALGLTLGTAFDPRSVVLFSSTIVLPMSFGGAIFYTWGSLGPIPWLKYALLVNPLVYMSEGFRAALIQDVNHMPLVAVYAALAGFAAVFTVLGIRGFKKRALS